MESRAALTATAKDDDRLVLPPFDVELALRPFWPPAAPEAEGDAEGAREDLAGEARSGEE